MKSSEIIKLVMKDKAEYSTISQKQKDWILNVAKSEGRVSFDGKHIYFTNCYFKISQCKRLVSGGSYVGSSVIQGLYKIEKYYSYKHLDTNFTGVCKKEYFDYLDDNGYKGKYELTNPYEIFLRNGSA